MCKIDLLNKLHCCDDNCSFAEWKQHTHRRQVKNQRNVFSNILETVGNTPLVKLNKIPQAAGLKCDVYVKVDFFNPGGSIKDRTVFRMVEEAEEQGRLKPGFTIIEPTTGNAGIALALVCAVKGYKCIALILEKISKDKEAIMNILGAKVIRVGRISPNRNEIDDEEILFKVAEQLNKEIPNSLLLDQFSNSANPLAHYDSTGEEIIQQMNGQVDMVVACAGTTGTIAGISAKVKKQCPKCEVVGVDPLGSQLALPKSLNETNIKSWEVEGIGFTKQFDSFNPNLIDRWIKTTDKMSMQMARRLIIEEGILSGESSGAALAGALIAAKDLKEGQTCVVILPDGIRNYMSKFVTDNWMEARGFKDIVNEHQHWWWDRTVLDLHLPKPKVIKSNEICRDALEFLNTNTFERAPVVNNNGTLEGFIVLKYLTKKVVSQGYELDNSIENMIFQQFYRVNKDTSLGLVSRILETEEFIAVVDQSNDVIGVINHLDLLNFISIRKAGEDIISIK